MIVTFENNVLCSTQEVLDTLLLWHPELENMLNNEKELCLVRLHEDYDTIEPGYLDLTGWKEESRKLYWANEQLPYNYSLIYFKRITKPLSISVIISTCNHPAWLEKVLWGYEAQTFKDFELIIADDGSRKETYDMLQKIVPQLSFLVKHVWHEDKGFRKCDILNKGVLAAQTDYLLFSDGDCIPRKDFVSTHLKLRRKGHFLSGGYHKLNLNLSRKIDKEDILSGRCFNLKWLKDNGMHTSFKNNKLTASGFKEWVLNTFTTAKASWNGHDASGWLNDIIAVNGFDERMQYGGQDREFGERLENYGIHGRQIRYSTVCLHLEHGRNYKTKESIRKNRNIRKHIRKAKVQWSSFGIVKKQFSSEMVKINSWYDHYTREEEKLSNYRQKGGIYKHLLSLPCQWRRAFYKSKVNSGYQVGAGAPILANQSGVIVSLTTYPPRISQLHLVLKSILWQTCPPEKIIVWLSEEEFPKKLDDLPESLKCLIANGVEFRFVPENLRSHKKYYYVFRDFPDTKVITVDDDLIYPRDTIARLLSMSYQHPDTVCANVVREIQMEGMLFLPYRRWKKDSLMPLVCSTYYVAIGCGGIFYPSHWYDEELFNQSLIMECCPLADDLWLKANELRRGVKVTSGGDFYPRPIELSGTQSNSLQRMNNSTTNLNDKQWGTLNTLWRLDDILKRYDQNEISK